MEQPPGLDAPSPLQRIVRGQLAVALPTVDGSLEAGELFDGQHVLSHQDIFECYGPTLHRPDIMLP